MTKRYGHTQSFDLKPCPFCGRPAMIRYYGKSKDQFSLGCEDGTCPGFDCFSIVQDHGYGEVERAVAQWNKRA